MTNKEQAEKWLAESAVAKEKSDKFAKYFFFSLLIPVLGWLCSPALMLVSSLYCWEYLFKKYSAKLLLKKQAAA